MELKAILLVVAVVVCAVGAGDACVDLWNAIRSLEFPF